MANIFICTVCSYESTKWHGKCPDCDTWNSLEERQNSSHPSKSKAISYSSQSALPINSLATIDIKQSIRIGTGSNEFDRVLGGGLLTQSVVLISGEPGIGKSTLLLQLAAHINTPNEHVLYICGEESPEQIKLRAMRLGLEKTPIQLSAEFRIEKIEQHIKKSLPSIIIIDSMQSIRSETLGLHTGSISQLRACINSCYEWSQTYKCAVIIVAHITKEGSIAGPKLIEHMVDTVLVFENSKENLRFLYSQKNRFGTIDEVAVFRMTEKGLMDISNSSHYFLEERREKWPSGICIVTTFEGTRPFLVEIQALTVPVFSNNRVFTEIVHSNQVFRIAAILERHVNISLSNQNIYINTAGGIRIQESGMELALALALYSAYHNQPLIANTCAMGEISLAGEIRSVQHFEQRCKQAEDFGITTLIVPKANFEKSTFSSSNIHLIPVSTIQETISFIDNKKNKQNNNKA